MWSRATTHNLPHTHLLYLHHFLSICFLLRLLTASVDRLCPLLPPPPTQTGNHIPTDTSNRAPFQQKTQQLTIFIIIFAYLASISASLCLIFIPLTCVHIGKLWGVLAAYMCHTTPPSLAGGCAVNHKCRWIIKGVAQKGSPWQLPRLLIGCQNA